MMVASLFLGNAPEVASATLCTYDPYPGTCAGSSMGEDPGIGTSDPGCRVLYPTMNLMLTCGPTIKALVLEVVLSPAWGEAP